MGYTKKIIQWVNICPSLKIFYLLDKNIYGFHTFWEEESVRAKKIISIEISAIGLTQMNFNRK